MTSVEDHQLDVIAVDLTPVLPGGENGGAKVFVLELMRRLAELAPRTQVVLLTQAASHNELATLDRPNVRRVMVLGESPSPGLRASLAQVLVSAFRKLPGRLKPFASRVGYGLKSASRRSRSASILRNLNADLLF